MHVETFSVFNEDYAVTMDHPPKGRDRYDIVTTLSCGYLSGRTHGRNEWSAERPIRKY